MLTKEEKDLLIAIENYLFSKNKGTIIDGQCTVYHKEDIVDPKALELYFKLYALNEKLLKEREV